MLEYPLVSPVYHTGPAATFPARPGPAARTHPTHGGGGATLPRGTSRLAAACLAGSRRLNRYRGFGTVGRLLNHLVGRVLIVFRRNIRPSFPLA